MPNSVNPQSNSLHSHTQLTTLSCTTLNILTRYPCLTTALASGQAVSLRVISGRVKKSKVTMISNLTLRPSLDYHYFLAISLTLYWCQKCLPSSCPYLFSCLLSCHFSALISFLVWSSVYF